MAMGNRFVFMLGLIFLVGNSYSAPTLNPTTKINTGENSTSSSQNEASSVEPTTVLEDTKEEVMVSRNSTDDTATTEEVRAVQNSTEKVNTLHNSTDASLKNVTASANATNTTEVEEYDGPSSILYPLCSNYLGVSNKKIIKDEQMSASSTLEVSDLMEFINSTLKELEHESNENSTSMKSNFTITGNRTAPHDGRLGNTEGSWCASADPLDGNGHHLVVDLGEVYIVEAVITQGRSDSDNWVTEYAVEYSSDKKIWLHVKNDRQQMIFKGNKDRDSIAVGSFPYRIAARYLKFTPKSFHGKLMCMRVEAVGCHPDVVNVARNQPVQQSNPKGNSTSSPGVVDGKFIPKLLNETCARTQNQASPWLRIDLRRSYQVQEIFISNQDHTGGYDMWDFEVRVGNSLDNEGNDNARCSPLYTLLPGQIGTLVCKNGTLGRYVNIRVDRDDVQLSLCEVAVIGVAETIVKLGLDDIANSLRTGAVVDKAGEMAGDVVGGLIGQLQNQLQGRFGAMLLGQGMGMLNNLKGQGLGMLNNLGGQGMGMLNNLQGQGMGMLNNLKGQGMAMANKMKEQGLAMANKLKNQGMEMANKMKEQGLEMANKMKEQGLEMANKMKEKGMEMANKAKEQGMEMANKAKKQAMEMADKAKKQGVEMANKAKEQGMAMANDLQNQGQAMVGDMQGQVNQQQDKFKKKLKEMLDKGKEYLEVGKEEMEKLKKKGYIETGKEYLDIGLGMTMDGIAFIQAKIQESLSNIAGDMTKQMTTLSEYDAGDIKGLLDDVDPVPVRNFVEEAKPKIGEFIDEMQKMAKKYMEVGKEKAIEAKDEIESEADSAAKDATSLGKNVAGKATAAGKDVANKAKAAGMDAANKAKAAGMDAVNKAKAAGMDAVNKAKDAGMNLANKAKSAGMDAVNKAKDAGMDAVNKAKEAGMGALDKAKSVGMGALDQAKGMGMGAFGDLQKAGMGALGQAQGLGTGIFGQLKQTGMGALGNLQGLGQGLLTQLSSAGQELLEKVKDMKPSTVKEMQQIQMLQQLKKMKQMQELEEHLELEQDSQWKEFEKLDKEMEDQIKKGEVKLEGADDFLKDNDAPDIGGTM